MGIRVLRGDGDTVTVAEGATWTVCFDVYQDGWLVYADVSPTVTIAPPIGAEEPATIVMLNGRYAASYVTTQPGRHLATITAAGYDSVTVAAIVRPIAAPPDVDEVRAYIGPTSADDETVQDALDAESDAQLAACRVPAAYPRDLRQALKRRVARNLAMRGLPLAILQGDSESGDTTVLPGNDPEVRRLEKPWRRLRMG